MKILVSDSISSTGIDILQKAGLEVDVKTGLNPDELKAIIGQYYGLIIRSATKVTKEIIEAAKNLKVIGRAGSGLDNVDKVIASKMGIVVMNTPGGNTITTAEHTIALIFSMVRKIPQANMFMSQGKWEKKKFMGTELYKKTLGIFGLGKIGYEVAKRMKSMGMNIIAFDPFLSDEQAKTMGIEKGAIQDVIQTADIITVHTPMTNETKNLINKASISMMKDGVYIVNCARGGIVNESDLLEALNSGKVSGAALDVFEKEPPENNPLVGHNKVICTPHLGASTEEAQENVAVAVAEQIVDYFVNGVIRNAVNFPSIPAEQAIILQPYITLAEKIGGMAAQLFEEPVTEIEVEFRGEVTELNTSPLTIAAIKGLLNPILLETINFVNAPLVAKERGISVKEIKNKESGDYQSLICLKIKSSKKEIYITGTLFSKKDPRIVKINNFTVEIVPEGHMLLMYNNDKPGVIGNVGTLIGKENINIARMHFGRESVGGRAISVINIDSEISSQLLEKIKSLPNILTVKVINL